MAKKEEKAPVKTTTVTLRTGWGYVDVSRIERDGGWPTITDKTSHAVEWLKAHGYKVTDIELIGEKPANWDTVWEIAPVVPVEVVVAPIVPTEPPALIDPIVAPADATAVLTEVVSNETPAAN